MTQWLDASPSPCDSCGMLDKSENRSPKDLPEINPNFEMRTKKESSFQRRTNLFFRSSSGVPNRVFETGCNGL
jgi:hypothetical protein